MIDVTRQVLLLRQLLLRCQTKVAKLDYENACHAKTFEDFERACWEIVLERSLVTDYPEVRGVESSLAYKAQIYPSSKRVIDPEAPTTHKLVCLPKEEISGIWWNLIGDAWHYLDRDQLLLWTERSLENFLFAGFGSWKKFLEDNLAKRLNPNDLLFSWNPFLRDSKNVPPLDSVLFHLYTRKGRPYLTGVAKAEELNFYLKEIKETEKISEEQEDLIARTGAIIDKRIDERIDKRMEEVKK